MLAVGDEYRELGMIYDIPRAEELDELFQGPGRLLPRDGGLHLQDLGRTT